MRVDPDAREASFQRRVFLVRLAAWSTVLVLAVIAFNIRAGANPPDQGANGLQLNGTTEQGQPLWVVTDGENVRGIDLKWKLRCDNGETIQSWGGTFRAGTDEFDFDGPRFSIEDRHTSDATDGWTVHVDVKGRGEAKAGGKRAVGTASAVMRFERDGQRGAECRSGQVSWSAGRG